MYLYTPNKKLLSDFRRCKAKDSRDYGNRLFKLLSGYFKDYTMHWTFQKHWSRTKFYSLTRRKHIPVNGLLFDMRFFDETEV